MTKIGKILSNINEYSQSSMKGEFFGLVFFFAIGAAALGLVVFLMDWLDKRLGRYKSYKVKFTIKSSVDLDSLYEQHLDSSVAVALRSKLLSLNLRLNDKDFRSLYVFMYYLSSIDKTIVPVILDKNMITISGRITPDDITRVTSDFDVTVMESADSSKSKGVERLIKGSDYDNNDDRMNRRNRDRYSSGYNSRYGNSYGNSRYGSRY